MVICFPALSHLMTDHGMDRMHRIYRASFDSELCKYPGASACMLPMYSLPCSLDKHYLQQ